jgi:hypothetical protein
MLGLGAVEIVDLWERGVGRGPTDRALLIVAASQPDRHVADIAALPIGRRDALLWAIREQTIGRRLAARIDCPACGVALEFDVDAAALGVPADAEPEPSELSTTSPTRVDDVDVVIRIPTSDDLLAISDDPDVASAAARLAERCLVSAHRGGRSVRPGALTPRVREAVAAAVAEADRLGDVTIDLSCAACGHTWTADLDIGSVFWTEIAAVAERLLREVDTLARAYAWHEPEILAMSEIRRQRYIELATS